MSNKHLKGKKLFNNYYNKITLKQHQILKKENNQRKILLNKLTIVKEKIIFQKYEYKILAFIDKQQDVIFININDMNLTSIDLFSDEMINVFLSNTNTQLSYSIKAHIIWQHLKIHQIDLSDIILDICFIGKKSISIKILLQVIS